MSVSCQSYSKRTIKKEHAKHYTPWHPPSWTGARALTKLEGGGRFVSPHGTPSWWAKGIVPSALFYYPFACVSLYLCLLSLFTVLSTQGTQHRRKILVNFIDFPSLITLFIFTITTVPHTTQSLSG